MNTEVLKITLLPSFKVIEVKSRITTEVDGEKLSRTLYTAYPPGSDMTDAPEAAKALAALWTQADIDAYRALGQPEDA